MLICTLNVNGQLGESKDLLALEYENIESFHGISDTLNTCNLAFLKTGNNGQLTFLRPRFCDTFMSNWSVPTLFDTSAIGYEIGHSSYQSDSIQSLTYGEYQFIIKPALNQLFVLKDSHFVLVDIDSQSIHEGGEKLFKVTLEDSHSPHPYKKTIWLSSKLFIVRISEVSGDRQWDMYLKSMILYRKRENYYFKSSTIEVPQYYPK